MKLTAGTPKSIKHVELHRGKPFAGDAIRVFPTSGKFCREILSPRTDSAPQRPPQARKALSKYFLIQTNSKQLVTKCSEANQALGKPAGRQDMDTTSQGKRHFNQAGSFSHPSVLSQQRACAVELCQQAAARCGPVPCSPALLAARINRSCLAKPAWLCLHLSDPSPAGVPAARGRGSPTSSF